MSWAHAGPVWSLPPGSVRLSLHVMNRGTHTRTLGVSGKAQLLEVVFPSGLADFLLLLLRLEPRM